VHFVQRYLDHQRNRSCREFMSHDAPEREIFACIDDFFMLFVPIFYVLMADWTLTGGFIMKARANGTEKADQPQPIYFAFVTILISILPIPILVYMSQHYHLWKTRANYYAVMNERTDEFRGSET